MIKPTVGRVVWYHPARNPTTQPEKTHAAIIAAVHGDSNVNLGCFDEWGSTYPAVLVPLYQGEGQRPLDGHQFCEWMPYQIGQAAKTDELQKSIGEHVHDTIK